MNAPCIEIARFRLKAEVSDEELRNASDALQDDFLSRVAGFLSRELLHVEGRDYVDLVRWRSKEAALAAMQKADQWPAAGAYFALVDWEAVDPSTAVTHCALLVSYG
jgi:heme-degrading monooxygenase HmoA